MKEQTKAAFETVKKKWEEDPISVTIAGAIALGALTKLVNALSAAQGRRAYSKQVKHLIKRRSR